MKYLLLIHHDEQAWARLSEAERERVLAEFRQLRIELTKSGEFLAGAPLEPTSTAKSVRVRDGRPLVTDGPFAETREQLAGYFVVETGDVDEAIGLAARIPAARWGTVEVRPMIEVPAATPA
jgi:hypothetical protein